MPRARFLHLPEAERDALLAIAVRQFAKRGFDGASLNEILAEAGLSKGVYYYYFDDKEDLFATVIEAELDKMLARVPPPSFANVTREQFWRVVEHQVERWAKLWSGSADLIQVMLHVNEAMRRSPRFATILARGYELYRPMLVAGQRVGCIRTDLPVDALIQLFEANDQVLDSIFLATHPTKITRAAFTRHVALVFDTLRRLLSAEAPHRLRKRGRRG